MIPGGAELVLSGGRIVTMADLEAEAIAIHGERIVAVGTTDEIVPLLAPGGTHVDLRGRTVIPGIVDAHAHMEREGLKSIRLSLEGAASIDDVLSIVRAAAATRPRGSWIVTMPVGAPPFYFGGPKTLAEGRMPTRHELDRVAPEHPVYISCPFNNWGEPPGYGSLNSLALHLNGITAASVPRCPGVTIEKDPATGEPTGVVIETNQRPTVEFDLLRAVPRFTYADRVPALRESMRRYNAVGTTSVYEGHGSAPETIAAYRTLWERGEMTVRAALVVSPSWTDVREAGRAMRDWLSAARGRGFGDPWLRISGVFVGLAGDPAIRAAALGALPDTGWSGFVEHANSMSDYRDYVALAAENDLRVHTIATQRVDEVLDIWMDMDERHGIRGKRWVLEHIATITQDQIAKAKVLGAHLTTIPSKAHWKRGYQYREDAAASDELTPHRRLLESGVPIAVGTDNVPYDPFFTLWNVVTRRIRGDEAVVGPGQCVDTAQGLALLTRQGARLSFDEDHKGTLEPGKLADLAVLDRDPFALPTDVLRTVGVDLTIVGGRIVHQRA